MVSWRLQCWSFLVEDGQYCCNTLFLPISEFCTLPPSVNDFWEQHKKELWGEQAGKVIILSGDGRNDSPGHSAQYCTY